MLVERDDSGNLCLSIKNFNNDKEIKNFLIDNDSINYIENELNWLKTKIEVIFERKIWISLVNSDYVRIYKNEYSENSIIVLKSYIPSYISIVEEKREFIIEL